MTRFKAAALDDITFSSNRAFEVGRRSILIARTIEGVFVFDNQRSHAQQPLEGAKMKAVFIFCPVHGARFDMRDGCPSSRHCQRDGRSWSRLLFRTDEQDR